MYNILIVDDDIQNIKICESILLKNDYSVGFLLESQLLIDRLNVKKPDLILLDVYMPEIDGITLLQEIKKHKYLSNIPIIMLTSDDDPDLLSRCFDGGAFDFIHKPVNDKMLLARIKNIIDRNWIIKQVEFQKESLEISEKVISQLYDQILRDLNRARKIQTTLVSQNFPKSSHFSFHSLYSPVDMVGGDFIIFDRTQEDLIEIFFGDVSGHGVSSAMIACMAILAFKVAVQTPKSPSQNLIQMHELLFPVINGIHFISAVYLQYKPFSKVLHYSYAGHHPIILERSNEIQELEGMGTAMVLFSEIHVEDYQISLQNDDKILLYSDGLIENFNQENEMYGLNGLTESYKRRKEEKDFELFLQGLAEDARNYCLGNLRDDITLLLLKQKS